jgi:hypothetical protein
MSKEKFDVWQFFADDAYEKVRARVGIKEALKAAYHYTHNVSALTGVTSRVIITDEGDCTVFEWKYEEGVTYPKRSVEVTSYKKLN